MNHGSGLFTFFELLFTYLGSSVVLFQLVASLVSLDRQSAGRYFVYCFGLGPMTIAWLFALLLWVMPHHAHRTYIYWINGLFLLAFLIGIKQLRWLPTVIRQAWQFLFSASRCVWLEIVLWLLIVSVLIALLVSTLYYPLSYNDPMQYAAVAKLIYQKAAVNFYPLLDPSHQGGLVTFWSHPLAYMSLLAWGFFIQGGTSNFFVLKLVPFAFAVYTLLLVMAWLQRQGKLASLLGGVLLLSTPLYALNVFGVQIDALRIFSFSLALLFLLEVLSIGGWRRYLVSAYTLSLCLFSHSAGVLVLPLYAVLFLLLAKPRLLLRIVYLALIFLLSLVLVIPRYVINWHIYGAIIHDGSPIWQLQSLKVHATTEMLRGIYFLPGRWLQGVFAYFTRLKLFGLSYWVLLLGFCFWRRWRVLFDRSWAQEVSTLLWLLPLLVLLMYFGMVVLSVLIGMDVFIKNPRYLMTVQVFAAILGGQIVAKCLPAAKKEGAADA